MSASARSHWSPWVKTLHWTSVLLILALAILGLLMVDMQKGSDIRKLSYGIHKSLGITLLVIGLLRLAVRALTKAPLPLPAPTWQYRIAACSHVLIYVLLLALPVSGWLLTSVAGQPLQWFWLFDVPALTGKQPDWRGFLDSAHVWLFWSLVSVTVAHASAALHHHLFKGDATLQRMLPGHGHPKRR